MTPFMGSPNSPLGTFLLVVCVMIGLSYLAYRIALAVLWTKLNNAVPENFRRVSTAVIWLSVIPGVAALVNFFIFPSLARSYRDALEAEKLGELAELKNLNYFAWGYPLIYVLPLVMYVIPTQLADAFINTQIGMWVLFYGDLIVLVLLMMRLNELKQNVRVARGLKAVEL